MIGSICFWGECILSIFAAVMAIATSGDLEVSTRWWCIAGVFGIWAVLMKDDKK